MKMDVRKDHASATLRESLSENVSDHAPVWLEALLPKESDPTETGVDGSQEPLGFV